MICFQVVTEENKVNYVSMLSERVNLLSINPYKSPNYTEG